MSRNRWPRPEARPAVVVWVVATVAVVAVAPVVARLPLAVTAPVATAACLVLGATVTAVLLRSGRLRGDHAGLRFGAAVAVIGQLLDVVLILAAGGHYPRTDVTGSARLLVLLLGGYAAFVVGAALAPSRRGGQAAPPESSESQAVVRSE